MTPAPHDRPSRFPWPPIIAVSMLAFGIALNFYVPLGWVHAPLSDFLSFLGVVLIGIALGFDIWAMRSLKAHKTTIMPHRSSAAIVTTGPYAISRNPIYVGNVLLLLSLALVFGNLWLLPLGLLGGFLTRLLAISGEEAHLAHKFPREWAAYRKKVRRWL